MRHLAKRAFVVGMIRRLRQLGPLPRRHRMPRQQQPDAIRLEYYKALLPFVHRITGVFHDVQTEILHLLMTERRVSGKMDTPSKDDAGRLVDRAERAADDEISRRRLEDMALKFGDRVSSFQRKQLDRQVRASLAVPLSLVEPHVTARLEGFAAENVSLIQGLTQRYFDRIRSDVTEAFEQGMHPNDLADLFQERDDMAERDARRIARDQIGKLMGQFNEERQKDLGITSYIWRTANDERVRDEHAEREGRQYDWSDPPEDGHPGEAIMCRCYAEPVFDQIIEDL